MPTYPSLSQDPDVNGFKEEPITDPTIRSEMESGDVVTRPLFTGVPLKWSYKYTQLSNADKLLLATFERSTVKYGALSFTWTNPQDDTDHEVRFTELVKYALNRSNNNEWDVQVALAQANVGS